MQMCTKNKVQVDKKTTRTILNSYGGVSVSRKDNEFWHNLCKINF